MPNSAAVKRRGSDEAHGGQTQCRTTRPSGNGHTLSPLNPAASSLLSRIFRTDCGAASALSLFAKISLRETGRLRLPIPQCPLPPRQPLPLRVVSRDWLLCSKASRTAFSCRHVVSGRGLVSKPRVGPVHEQRQPLPWRPGRCMSDEAQTAKNQSHQTKFRSTAHDLKKISSVNLSSK